MVYKCKFHVVSQDDKPKHQGRLIIQATITVIDVAAKLLVDSGAIGPILSQQFVRDSQLMRKRKNMTVTVTTATDETIEGACMYYIPLTTLKIKYHDQRMLLEVGKMKSGIGSYLLVKWLTCHDSNIN